MKIPNFPYHIARAEGALIRRVYNSILPTITRRRVCTPGDIALDVFSYSGESALPEQVASIRSFLACAGRPKRFTVFSDGTYSPHSIQLLEAIDPVVRVRASPPPMPPVAPEKLRAYLTSHPTGKQLAFIMSLPLNGPALYADSDVLFFPDAREISALAQTADVPAFYLADCRFSGDERLLRSPVEEDNPVNTGFLLLFQPLDWSLSVARFLELQGAPNFFTNQTMTHLTMHANGAQPFDSRKFVLQLDDQFVYPDRYANPGIAMRHYVNPVRHKFWASLRASGSNA